MQKVNFKPKTNMFLFITTLLLAYAQANAATTYAGQITDAVGLNHTLNGRSCTIQVNNINEKHIEGTLIVGQSDSEKAAAALNFNLDSKKLYPLDKVFGYDYGRQEFRVSKDFRYTLVKKLKVGKDSLKYTQEYIVKSEDLIQTNGEYGKFTCEAKIR